MKGKILLAGIVTTVMCMTTLGFVYADTSYTFGDLKNLQDFILGKETNDLEVRYSGLTYCKIFQELKIFPDLSLSGSR